jgi:hypothetical protein
MSKLEGTSPNLHGGLRLNHPLPSYIVQFYGFNVRVELLLIGNSP